MIQLMPGDTLELQHNNNHIGYYKNLEELYDDIYYEFNLYSKWIAYPNVPKWYEWYICSNCKCQAPIVHINGHLKGGTGAEAIEAEWVSEKKSLLSPFCPNCGRRMDNADKISIDYLKRKL